MPVAGQAVPFVPDCTDASAPSRGRSGWDAPVALRAAAERGTLSKSRLQAGQAVRLILLPTPKLRFQVQPVKLGASTSFGGMAQIEISAAGLYRVSLGTAAWIDLVTGDKAIMSIAHEHGPQCSGIRKMVDFRLSPGRYVLQIAGNGAPETTLLVAHLPG